MLRMTFRKYQPLAIVTIGIALVTAACADARRGPALSAADVAEIVKLERIEDRRIFDAEVLERVASASHPELRRRAALAIARLYESRGRALLEQMRAETDTAVLATVVWATGQLVDTSAVPWLDSLLQNPATPVGVATEAAGAFGKIRTTDTRRMLSTYLEVAAHDSATAPVVGEALLSIGRTTERGPVESIARWATSPNESLRWRSAWALAGIQDPAAVPALLELSEDPSADVKSWALRGLPRGRVDSSTVSVEAALAVLLSASHDLDRRVQAVAHRTLATYVDRASLRLLISRLDAPDMWAATTAAEALGRRGIREREAIAPLVRAASSGRTSWLRAVALTALADASLADAQKLVAAASTDTSLTVRSAAVSTLARLGAAGRDGLAALRTEPNLELRASVFAAYFAAIDSAVPSLAKRRDERNAALASPDVAERAGAIGSMLGWADATDFPALIDAFARGLEDSAILVPTAAIEVLAEIDVRGKRRITHDSTNGAALTALVARFPTSPSDIAWGDAGRAFGTRILPLWGPGRPVRTTRTDADYERIVRTLIVPAYDGDAPPRLRWETTRGAVDTKLNPLDAPLATDYLLQLVAQGAMRDIRFERVVPNFVAQQGVVLIDQPLQRDEISRGRLVRGNLSWGSWIGYASRFPDQRGPGAAYDTGPAAYVFAHTPQPHNEGDFVALGQITRGQEAADRMELGDFVKSVRVLKPGEK